MHRVFSLERFHLGPSSASDHNSWGESKCEVKALRGAAEGEREVRGRSNAGVGRLGAMGDKWWGMQKQRGGGEGGHMPASAPAATPTLGWGQNCNSCLSLSHLLLPPLPRAKYEENLIF